MKRIIFSIIVCFVTFNSEPTSAALINVSTQDLATNQINYTACSVSNSSNASEQCTSGPATALNGAIGFGQAYANIVTGELKAQVSGTATDINQVSVISAIGQAAIKETVHVTGTGIGTITAYQILDGIWSLAVVTPAALQFQIQAQLSLTGGLSSSPANFFVNQSNDSGNGSVDLLMTATATVSGDDTLQFDASLLTQIVSANGAIDFYNTARFLIVASEGFSISFDDPRFLSDPSFSISQVPEPTGLVLFGTSLLGLAYARHRREAAKLA